jgi:TRAP-type uncharacterized transport system fused permease subunit
LFIVYYAMLSCLTPPVAVVAFLGASIAEADAMKTALLSMRLGFVKYFIPLFFLFNPSLILQGELLEGVFHFLVSIVGVVIMAGGLDGYLVWIGRISATARALLVAAGLLMAFPDWMTTTIGGIIGLFTIGVIKIRARTLVGPRVYE